jgi:hypothetical protein
MQSATLAHDARVICTSRLLAAQPLGGAKLAIRHASSIVSSLAEDRERLANHLVCIRAAAPQIAELTPEGTMAVPQTSGYFRFQPATKRQADVLALKLFCLGSFILLGLITAGVL